MNCKICNSETQNIFAAKILNKYNIKYYHCYNCGFLQTEEPYWLGEAYQESINIQDTGLLSRNLHLSKQITVILFFLFNKKAKYLDFAGGYGVLTRFMRDIGFDFYWSDKYSKNLFARGFEYNENIKNIELITSFESLEHFVNPLEEIEKMLKTSKNILASTVLLPNPLPNPNEWWYYGLGHGQHISFYSIKTLKFIAQKYGLNLYSNGINLHLLTIKKINRVYFRYLLRLNRFGLFLLCKKSMKSKTFNDMKSVSALK